MSERLPDEKRGQSPFVRSTHRAVPANGDCPLFSSLPIAAEFWPLLDAACADELTDDQTAELQSHLESNPVARRAYIANIQLRTNIRQWWKGERARASGLCRIEAELMHSTAAAGDMSFGENLSVGESIEQPHASFPPFSPPPSLSTARHPLSTDFIGGPVFSYMVATVVLCVMLLSAWAYKITNIEEIVEGKGKPSIRFANDPRFNFVGRVTGVKDCVWAKDSLATMVGASVPMRRKYELISGLMEITYNSGARVILEGPCEYTVDSAAGGYLAVGKLTARMEIKAEKGSGFGVQDSGSKADPSSFIPHPSSLFSVTTPTAVVTDLGTEFGVEVDGNGDTTSHVFRGAVKVQATGTMQMEVLLRANESARVKKDGAAGDARIITGGEVSAIPKFIRRLIEPPKEIDLLDIVAGGNGTGKHRERGINAATGWKDSFFVSVHRGGDREYRQVKWHGMIDGVFVPDGETGPVTIDSAGHAFDGFPDTTSDAFGSIWARAAKPRYYDKSFDQSHSEWIYAMGRGEQFMPDGRGLLGLHPNAGITFDLAAIRRAFSGAVPSRFNAVAGMADASRLNDIADGMADLWVFVDGRVKLKRTKFRPQDGTFVVDVEIKPDDRFLTLVATDGGNTADSDWSVFGDPVLRMTETDLDKQTEDRPMEH